MELFKLIIGTIFSFLFCIPIAIIAISCLLFIISPIFIIALPFIILAIILEIIKIFFGRKSKVE